MDVQKIRQHCPDVGVLELHDLAIGRASHMLLAHLNWSLPAGKAVVVKGGNGTGKSTLLRTLGGFIPPLYGELTINQKPFRPHHPDCPLIVTHYRLSDGLAEEMNGYDQLRLYQRMRGRAPHLGKAEQYDRFSCSSFINKEVRYLSTGQRQRVALTRLCLDIEALHHHHHLGQNLMWLLDEPDSGLDEEGRLVLEELISDMLNCGGRVVMVSHLPRKLRFPHHLLNVVVPAENEDNP